MEERFVYAKKSEKEENIPAIFEILYDNMAEKYPTGDTKEEDYRIWSSYFIPSLMEEKRKLVLLLGENGLIGYFQYSIENKTFKMEDLQVREEYHGSGLFRRLYTWIVKQLPRDLEWVEAFTDKRNRKTQGILEHLGMVRCGENKSGKSYFYRGEYRNLLGLYTPENEEEAV